MIVLWISHLKVIRIEAITTKPKLHYQSPAPSSRLAPYCSALRAESPPSSITMRELRCLARTSPTFHDLASFSDPAAFNDLHASVMCLSQVIQPSHSCAAKSANSSRSLLIEILTTPPMYSASRSQIHQDLYLARSRLSLTDIALHQDPTHSSIAFNTSKSVAS